MESDLTDSAFDAARAEYVPRLALALDIDSLDRALDLAHRLIGYLGIAKVGLELFSSAGPLAVRELQALGYEVFIDLKLHDIPTTVGHAARVLGGLGARYATVHTSGGEAMCRAAAEGFAEGAAALGQAAPIVLGVTVLTSDASASEDVLAARAALAASAGLGGLVCAAPDLPVVRAAAPGLVTMVPGTRPPGASLNDQMRVTTPAEAIALGADVLVVGRAVTDAEDPVAAAVALLGHLAAAATSASVRRDPDS
jgi:orotidine-5'-phosphate decarboxylase